MTFKTFSKAVHSQYNSMAKGELFVVDVGDIYASYLAAFPAGTDPIYRVRTQHDCNCCKNFIRRLGILVSIDANGNRQTVWDDFPEFEEPYGTVARTLANLVRQAPIIGVFRSKERQYGSEPNWDNHDTSIKWDHFVGKVETKHFSTKPDEARGEKGAIHQVLNRGLNEISLGDIETVLELIEANALYRGAEHVTAIKAFRELKQAWQVSLDRETFVWANLDKPAARFRNTVIGTLLTDLAEGVELEQAVKKFEAKVAPENYKRPTALITPRMIEQAVATLDSLGLTDAVERRYAVIEDVNVQDVLFVDNEVRGKMKGGLTDLLMGAAKTPRFRADAPTPISIDDFMKLGASMISLVLSNQQLSNFVSLTAPRHPDTGRLFKWRNDFAWMYDGELADTGMRERVKAAGGRIDGQLRVSLGWFNGDDLDLHCQLPDRGHVYFHNKMGLLDVDMNAGGARNSTDPVENMAWKMMPRDGDYQFWVHQYCRRSRENDGFKLEIEARGVIHHLSYPKPMRDDAKVMVTLTIKDGQLAGIKHGSDMTSTSTPAEKWGIKTLTPIRVDTIMLSPNYWDGAGDVGNSIGSSCSTAVRTPTPLVASSTSICVAISIPTGRSSRSCPPRPSARLRTASCPASVFRQPAVTR